MTELSEPKYEVVAETENFIVWKGEETDGEISYHLEVGNAMLTFYTEEWIEMLTLMKEVIQQSGNN